MNSARLYSYLKRKLNQDHSIFMFGVGSQLIKSAYTLIRESREEDPDNAGCFYTCHLKTGLPAIYIYLNDPMHRDALDKVITLSHEYGHFVSYQTGRDISNTATDLWHEFQNSIKLSEEQKALVVEEEIRAWNNARELLKEYLSPDDVRWKRFNNTKATALRSYRRVLKKYS